MAPARPWRRNLLAAAALGAVFWAHGGALSHGFHYDDVHSVVDNPHLRSLIGAGRFFTDPTTFSARPERAMFRPLVVLSYALTYRLADLTPWAHLLVNLLAHMACGGLVFAVARRLRAPFAGAAVAASLFLLHPVNAEVANYVSSRSESFAAAGLLASLWAWLRWRQDGGAAAYALALAAFALALLSKATAVALPAMLLAGEACTAGRRRWLAVVPFVATAVAYAAVVSSFARRALGDPVRPLAQQVWTQVKALVYYLRLLVLPSDLSVEHDFAVSPSPADPSVLAAAALLASLAAVVWVHGSPRTRRVAAWAALAVAPASLVPLNVLVNEHRVYLAGACLAVGLVPWLAAAVRPRRAWMGAGGAIVLVLLAGLSHRRGQVWETERSLWTDAVRKAPHAYRAHMHLGGAQEEQGDIVGALDSYRRAAQLAPHVAETQYNLGNALRLTGHPDQARAAWERAVAADPRFVDALLNLAASYQEEGDWPRAWELLRRAEAAQPTSAEVWRRKGVALKQTGDLQGAEAALARSLEYDGTRAETHFNLANLYYEEGRLNEAVRHYERALAADPDHHGAAYNLADLELATGDPAAAERICRDALRQGALRYATGQSKLFYLLARALDAQGRTAEALTNYRVFLAARAAPPAVLEAVRRRIEQLQALPR